MTVFLVGAGPGDAELLTCKAARLLGAADLVLHDSLVGPGVLALAKRARLIDVGKRCGRHSATQEEICRLLVEAARGGACVVRLKGGDPGIFGRATEEMAALEAAGIDYELVPGVTAACAAAAGQKISLTRRGVARAVHFLTGHGAEDGLPAHDEAALARAGGTLALYMASRTLAGFAARLLAAGLDADLPALAVEQASLPGERALRGTLATLPGDLAAAAWPGPVLVLIGAALAD